ncbi:hypothetical protein D3C79_748250 [compost metagenome]
MARLEHLLFALFAQAGIGAVRVNFAQRFFQPGLLVAVVVGLGLFDLFSNRLALGCATGERGLFFGGLGGVS